MLEGVIEIPSYAFAHCASLQNVTIPSSVQSIEFGAFEGCTSLQKITLPFIGDGSSNTHFGYIFGASSYSDNSSYVPSSLQEVIITNGTTIASNAFYNCNNIIKITLPEAIASIEESAFSGCINLSEVTIEEGIISIDSYAFEDCTSLESITIPSSVINIEESAFSGCTSLKSITLPFIGDGSGDNDFGYIFGITRNYHNEHVPSSLQEVTITGGQNIPSFAFSNCNNIIKITLPEAITSIGEYAFSSCISLQNITIPSNVQSIGESAFYWCTKLQSIIVDSNNPIYDSRDNCNAIIETSTNTLIVGCKNTIIPTSVISIGSSAFSGCASLQSIEIPSSITSIEDGAFSSCISLSSIIVDSNNPKYDSRDNCNAIIETSTNTLIAGCKNTIIPESVTSIGYSAFEGCTSLQSIKIPSSVKTIGEYAFYGCGNLTEVIFEDPNNWKVDGNILSSDDLNNSELAISYLTFIYTNYTWTKEE